MQIDVPYYLRLNKKNKNYNDFRYFPVNSFSSNSKKNLIVDYLKTYVFGISNPKYLSNFNKKNNLPGF